MAIAVTKGKRCFGSSTYQKQDGCSEHPNSQGIAVVGSDNTTSFTNTVVVEASCCSIIISTAVTVGCFDYTISCCCYSCSSSTANFTGCSSSCSSY